MNYNNLKLGMVAVVLLYLTGCATFQNVPHQKSFWTDTTQSIGVAVAPVAKPSTHKTGNQGLLDIAINNSMAGDLDTQLSTQNKNVVAKANELADKLTEYLNSKNFKAVRVTDTVKDWTVDADSEVAEGKKPQTDPEVIKLEQKYKINKLVLITYSAVGTIRSYYGFIPTGSPAGYANINGKLINLSNNKIEWAQMAVMQSPNTTADWDEPPKFPGLTKAMENAITSANQTLYNSFVQ